MTYPLQILQRALKREKYFGRSSVVRSKGKQIIDANNKLIDERIPQLERAMRKAITHEHQRTKQIDNQLTLFT